MSVRLSVRRDDFALLRVVPHDEAEEEEEE